MEAVMSVGAVASNLMSELEETRALHFPDEVPRPQKLGHLPKAIQIDL